MQMYNITTSFWTPRIVLWGVFHGYCKWSLTLHWWEIFQKIYFCVLRDTSYNFMIRRRKEQGSNRGWETVSAIRIQAPFILPPQVFLIYFLHSNCTATILLKHFITFRIGYCSSHLFVLPKTHLRFLSLANS